MRAIKDGEQVHIYIFAHQVRIMSGYVLNVSRERKMIKFIKKILERRRQRRVAKFMFNQALDSYDYFIGLDDDGGASK